MTKQLLELNYKKYEKVAEPYIEITDDNKLPPIIVQVNEYDEFITVVDGFHRILAYRELGIVRTFAIYVEICP